MDGEDVEEIFKDVLTDESQNSHDSVLPATNTTNLVSPNSFPINHTPMNVSPAIIGNQQPNIIPQTPSSLMSPSHSGMEYSQIGLRFSPILKNICMLIYVCKFIVIQGNLNMTPNRNAPPQPQVLPSPQNIPSPATYPASSPYHSEYSKYV